MTEWRSAENDFAEVRREIALVRKRVRELAGHPAARYRFDEDFRIAGGLLDEADDLVGSILTVIEDGRLGR